MVGRYGLGIPSIIGAAASVNFGEPGLMIVTYRLALTLAVPG